MIISFIFSFPFFIFIINELHFYKLNSNLNKSLPSNKLNIGGKTVIFDNDEGINFIIYSADGSKVWEIDCYDNHGLRFYNILDDIVRAVTFTPEGDVVTASGTSLNNLASHVNNQIISRTFSAVTTGGEASPLTAENVDGYNFLCWVGVASSGFIGTPYIENHEAQTTQIFDKNYYEGTDKNYLATALYIKS